MPLTVCADPVSERGLTHADSARHRDNRSRIIHNLPGRLVAKLRCEVLFSAGHLQPPLPDGPYWRSAVRKARGSPHSVQSTSLRIARRVCRLCLGPCLIARAGPWVLGGCKRGAARHAAYAAGQAGAVAHVAAHELGAAAYAIKAARAAAPEGEGEAAGRLECRWQRDQLPEAIRELVLDDQRLRNDICWSVFDC